MRRAKAFAHILDNIPIIIRRNELIVGSTTLAPRGCQTYPEFSYEWLEAEFDTVEQRSADPFYISEKTKNSYMMLNVLKLLKMKLKDLVEIVFVIVQVTLIQKLLLETWIYLLVVNFLDTYILEIDGQDLIQDYMLV